jgi:spore germination cell wall hydrolase CwlJ-like protein
MPRWTRQTLVATALAAVLGATAIFLSHQWSAAVAAVVPPPAVSHVTLPEQLRSRALDERVARNASRQLECLALNIYWEAKSEPLAGKRAVAAVTLNRVLHPAFPKTICEVVYQGVGDGARSCQFSWACDRRPDRPRDAAAWAEARQLAHEMLYVDVYDPTGGALYFHATYVRPTWARSMVRLSRIGRHVFYREPMSAEDDTRRGRS